MKRIVAFVFFSWTILLAAQDVSKGAAELQQAIKDGKASLVVINTTPSGAQIAIDGKPLPTSVAQKSSTPLLFALLKKEAPRTITIALDGYKPVERQVDPTGAPVAIEVTLEPLSIAGDRPAASVPVAAAGKPTNESLPSPFGFRYGSTKEELIKQLGSAAVVKSSAHGITFNTAPNPHADFELYTVFFSPAKGLLKVSAVSKDISTGDDGSELRDTFNRLKSALETKYGRSKMLDDCKGSDVSCEPQFFMMQLLEKNRSLFTLWQVPAIVLEAKALGIHKGFVRLDYEFPGWNEFVDENNSKKNSVF